MLRDWLFGACCLQIEEATRISAERLESQLHKVKQTIDDDKENGQETPYALIIDGKALLYALSPRLRQLFLEVSCSCCVYHAAEGCQCPGHCQQAARHYCWRSLPTWPYDALGA